MPAPLMLLLMLPANLANASGRFLSLIRSLVSTTPSIMPGRRTSPIFVIVPYSPARIVFLGMNPGPYGMAQTGVPFGEIPHVRDWIGINQCVRKPGSEHPARPVEGFDCTRSEVSGRRLWGLFKERFVHPEEFFAEHFVANYCPLVFMEESGRNRTPDKLPAEECAELYRVCDEHLRALVLGLQAEWVIGVGGFAQSRAKAALKDLPVHIGRVLHPSPASPAANRGWAEQATRQMMEQGLWE